MTSITSSERRVQLDDGAYTTLERWGEHGPVLLAIHGMSGSRKAWTRFAEYYADRYRVFAYDQRGHGDSAGVHGPMALHRGLLDLYNVIDAIGEAVDVLVGHSWGGATALLGGKRFDIGRIVAIDPMIRQASAQWYAEFLDELAPAFALEGAARDAAVVSDMSDWPEVDRRARIHAQHAMSLHTIEALRDENPADTWDLRGDLEEYPKPLLLAMAEEGQSILEPQDLAHVRERVGPNARIVVFDGQGHSLHRTDFARFTRTMEDFLAATASVSPPV
ncbi:MAG: alpha/beta fold hydrolase [Vulcanimicrobiaceae bacterium]